MQWDRLGLDHAFMMWNREVSLIHRSNEYMFLWDHQWVYAVSLHNGLYLVL